MTKFTDIPNTPCEEAGQTKHPVMEPKRGSAKEKALLDLEIPTQSTVALPYAPVPGSTRTAKNCQPKSGPCEVVKFTQQLRNHKI